MTRKRLIPALAALLVLVLAGGGVALWSAGRDSGPGPGFLTTKGTDLRLDGERFAAAGSNNYWPAFAQAPVVDSIFQAAADNDFGVMRIWAFNDIGDPADPTTSIDSQNTATYFQYWDGEKPAQNEGENGLVKLDYAVASAKERGIKLVMPFVNNWGPYGGMGQYVSWAGLDDHGAFYTDPQIKQWYKDWVTYLLNRTNTITGVKYKDEPAIGIWELANEPRCDGVPQFPSKDCSSETIVAWVEEMAAHFKSIDSKHILGLGDEGFMCTEETGHWAYTCSTGQDSRAFAQIDDLDVVGMHVYPDHWETDVAWSRQWILDHVAIAEEVGKPVFIGEYGWRGDAPRNVVFHDWIGAFEDAGGDLALSWWMQPRTEFSTPLNTDGFLTHCPSPVCTQTTYRSRGMASGARNWPPVPEVDLVTAVSGQPASVDLLANDVSLYGEIDPASVDLDPEADGVQSTLSIPAGELSVEGGVLTFTPASGFTGRADATYTVDDSAGLTSAATMITFQVGGS
ncbi:MAG: cellulase family glycosylhydrolase [Actinomycetota bacterium]|nr:cellulase family glycosylhydrolase [Actinomycetota bacterium]